MIKKRTQTTAEQLARELADRPIGGVDDAKWKRTSVTLTPEMLRKLENLALKNKQTQQPLKSVSALIRHAIENVYN